MAKRLVGTKVKNVARRTTSKATPLVLAEESQELKPAGKRTSLFLVVGIVVVLGVLGYFFRHKYLVAIVNNRPIFRYQLSQKMTKTVGNEFLENMIIEELIRQEAKKQGVVVTPADVAAEVDRLSQSLGEGVEIEDALKFQGLTMEEFRSQLETRFLVDRILGKQVAITTAEVDTFLKDSSELLTATAEAERRNEAEGRIKEEKISQLVQGWVSDLRQQAKIQRFLPGPAL